MPLTPLASIHFVPYPRTRSTIRINLPIISVVMGCTARTTGRAAAVAALAGVILAHWPSAHAFALPFSQEGSDDVSSLWRNLLEAANLPSWAVYALPAMALLTGILVLLQVLRLLGRNRGPYSRYRKDVFFDVPWTWEYGSRKRVVGLRCTCPECDATLSCRVVGTRFGLGQRTELHCEACDATRHEEHCSLDFLEDRIIRQIEHNIRTGEWEDRTAAVGDSRDRESSP